MSSEPQKYEWLIILPDQDGALPRRMEVRQRKQKEKKEREEEENPPKKITQANQSTTLLAHTNRQHLSNLQTYPSDFWLWGGGFLEDVPKEGEPMKMLGSAMLAWAATKEEVLEKLKRDVYTENQVWDWSKVQIYPFKSAIRKPL
ncbi:ycii-related domain protein [Diplodia corticola]|uniref:Ycii-related domain protein n=1 Tax=Diplodia corticola TaxID=236234 RepID=A0A1J9QK00_9PEZI|nr:ycii-related domain protein [Diplodia corticola]OJD28801.1 ycii-related domain protein [Diplodia corticola]